MLIVPIIEIVGPERATTEVTPFSICREKGQSYSYRNGCTIEGLKWKRAYVTEF